MRDCWSCWGTGKIVYEFEILGTFVGCLNVGRVIGVWFSI